MLVFQRACLGVGAKPQSSWVAKKGMMHQHTCPDLQGSPLGTSACFLPWQRKTISNINPGMAWMDFSTPLSHCRARGHRKGVVLRLSQPSRAWGWQAWQPGHVEVIYGGSREGPREETWHLSFKHKSCSLFIYSRRGDSWLANSAVGAWSRGTRRGDGLAIPKKKQPMAPWWVRPWWPSRQATHFPVVFFVFCFLVFSFFLFQ